MIDGGIVTLCDEHYFPGLLMLHRSVQESFPVPVACYDLGLTEAQRATAAARENLMLLPLPDDPLLKHIREKMGDAPPLAKVIKRVWPLWICPILIREAPFRDVIWMDCDLVVLRNLAQFFAAIEDGPVFTPENKAPAVTPNKLALYELLPIHRNFDPLKPTVNAGVSGWRKDRDAEVLAAYLLPVARAADDFDVRAAISWHDQGALIWAIQSLGLEHRVVPGNAWNLCVDKSPIAGRTIPWDEAFLDVVRREVPDAYVVHWNGSKPPWMRQPTPTVSHPIPSSQPDSPRTSPQDKQALVVGAYYDKWSARYLEIFGDTFQACRPTNVDDLHRFVMERAGLGHGQRILDAGCGVCGPSCYFATHLDVRIDAVTISTHQATAARSLVQRKGLEDRVTVHCGDYSKLGSLFPSPSFDRVLFLESLSHAVDPRAPLRGAFHVLRPGGRIFIKDFFALDGESESETRWMREVQDRVNKAFALKTPFLNETLQALSEVGFELQACEPVGFAMDDSVWSAFNRAHRFDLYQGGRPVQWCEWVSLSAKKPLIAN